MSARSRQHGVKSPPSAVRAKSPDTVRVTSNAKQTPAVTKNGKIERQPSKEGKPKKEDPKQPKPVKAVKPQVRRATSKEECVKGQTGALAPAKSVEKCDHAPVPRVRRAMSKEECVKGQTVALAPAKGVEKCDAPVPRVRRATSQEECVKRQTSWAMAPAKSVGKCHAPAPGVILSATLEKLKIKRTERSECAGVINDIIQCIKDHMKKNTVCFSDVGDLRTGSYYENLKISNPDEFDVMLTFPVDRVEIKRFGDDGAFYSVAFKRGKHPLDRFLHEDKTISAYMMLEAFRKEVKTCVKSRKDVEVERKKSGCPAVTLLVTGTGTAISLDVVLSLEVQSSWPSFANDGFQIQQWLGTKVRQDYRRRQPYYLVPKYEGKGTVEREGIFAKDVWRISFSHVEKSILMNHGSQKTCCEAGGSPCCRKDCLKLLKHLLSLLKEKYPSLSKFCSYHGKTTLFHACCSRTKDSEWQGSDLAQCFQLLLEDFEGHLKNGLLPNFFIPTQNLLSGIDRKSCLSLAEHIATERNNGFPIFHA